MLDTSSLELSHIVDAVLLSQVHMISIDDAQHSHSLENVPLSLAISLVVGDISQSHSISGSLTLSQIINLLVNNLYHNHDTSTISIVQQHQILPSDIQHVNRTTTLELEGLLSTGALQYSITTNSMYGINVVGTYEDEQMKIVISGDRESNLQIRVSKDEV